MSSRDNSAVLNRLPLLRLSCVARITLTNHLQDFRVEGLEMRRGGKGRTKRKRFARIEGKSEEEAGWRACVGRREFGGRERL